VATGVDPPPFRARHEVRIPVRKDDDVTGLHPHLSLVLYATPAASREQDVVGDQVLGVRQHPRHELARGERCDRPRRGRLHQIKVRAVEAHRAQHVGERVHRPPSSNARAFHATDPDARA
jgi:hypothetical protein